MYFNVFHICVTKLDLEENIDIAAINLSQDVSNSTLVFSPKRLKLCDEMRSKRK